VWILPTVFALVALSLPVQLYIAEQVGQPYPGLFQPTFDQVPGHERAVRYRAILVKIDGRVIEEERLFPRANPGRRFRLLQLMFPPEGGSANVDRATRERWRSRFAEAPDAEPRILTADWQRRRFDLDTRRTSVIRTIAEYRIDLAGGDR
jgi:hypothetical protein